MTNYEHRDAYPGVTANAVVKNARKAADFYAEALGATVNGEMMTTEDGRIMHCELRINGGPFMINDPFPEQGMGETPQGCTMTIVVEDAQAWWDRGIAAGMTVVLELHDAFWGDKYGQFADPFGVTWAIVGPSDAAGTTSAG